MRKQKESEVPSDGTKSPLFWSVGAQKGKWIVILSVWLHSDFERFFERLYSMY